MRYTKEHKQETRRRIVKVASKAFREHGIDGVSVPDIMAKAGLTHGGFYAHFESKEALAVECVQYVLDLQSKKRTDDIKNRASEEMASRVDYYLSPRHRDDRSNGCPIAALANEAATSNHKVAEALTEGVERMHESIQKEIWNDDLGDDASRLAYGVVSAMVGAIVLARLTKGRPISDDLIAGAKDLISAASPPDRGTNPKQ